MREEQRSADNMMERDNDRKHERLLGGRIE